MRQRSLIAGTVVVALGLLLATCAYGPGDPRNDLVGAGSKRIASGKMLGVSIGDQWKVADQRLWRQFGLGDTLWSTGKYVSEGGTGEKLGHSPVLRGEAEVSYRDRSWRNGVITLYLVDGRVAAIGATYVGPFYVDL